LSLTESASREPFDAIDLARRLTARFPSCFTYVVEGLVGATPELLLSRRGDRVRSRALAGTAARDEDEARDAALGAALLASDKDLREHAYAAEIDTFLDRLIERLEIPGSIRGQDDLIRQSLAPLREYQERCAFQTLFVCVAR
jgi:isochorismate synthase EntC